MAFAHTVTICASCSDGNVKLIQDFCFHNCASFLTNSLAHFHSQILFLCQDLLSQVPVLIGSLFPEEELEPLNRIKPVSFSKPQSINHNWRSKIIMLQKTCLHDWCGASKSGIHAWVHHTCLAKTHSAWKMKSQYLQQLKQQNTSVQE